ncbi:phage tail sheath C-terminal domain-containing protein [Hymenobacter bucti]|uniref:Phage tail sheath C-terminal domain-containing protein n=1 Tax=Hymenobacter bucti TaxID=1844114 RepID=A0ABW4QSW8_9BACT
MQPQYKTPGVYTIEQNAFPNSVVGVDTAIPAFIGYTQRASYKGKDLSNVPTKVESLKEFQDYFGAGYTQTFDLQNTLPASAGTGVVEAGSLKLSSTATQPQYLVPATTPYYLYSAMQLFYQNGGSTCYVVSVGPYDDSDSDAKHFEDAIDLLVYEQDPTMLLCPDAMRLDKDGYNQVMTYMLAHCAQVQSRVALFDVYQGAVTKPTQMDQQGTINNFREGVGQNNLNYGIAYFPWVQTSILDSKADVSFLNLTPAALDALKTALNPDQAPAGPLTGSVKAVTGLNATLTGKATQAAADAATAATQAATDADAAATDADTAATDATDRDKKGATLATNPADTQAQQDFAAAQTKAAASANTAAQSKQQAAQSAAAAIKADSDAAAAAAAITANIVSVGAALAGGSTITAQVAGLKLGDPKQNIFEQAKILFDTTEIAKANPKNSDTENSKALKDKQLYINNALVAQFPAYALAMTVVARYLNTMPVAPAMAGVYTAVDNSRGVWKAPANVSLNAVVAPTISLSDLNQETLNVDALTGKSINAIRTFRGMGTMVWGGRTLDGNSQDWRFINVRRTMIMIEQSVKLAARSYVFEPNDANTWTTMKSMINNFLNNLWKQGALAGATPAEAYTVQIGLGTTMTANDILDGYLNVSVLVALVHPAEFIVLTFKQEMQTS